MGMEEFRSRECGWCGGSIEGCSDRGGQEVSCVYGEIILPVLFLLQGLGWLKQWLRQEGYQVGFGVAQMQRWLNANSDGGGFCRSRATEAFEAYCSEFQRDREVLEL